MGRRRMRSVIIEAMLAKINYSKLWKLIAFASIALHIYRSV